ncbi:MAG: YfiR family protein [Raineya sp.]|jgi:hypothetical protein|nr:YfiR family protein [Raineya sp.]
MSRALLYRIFGLMLFVSIGQSALGQGIRNYAHHPIYIYNFCRFTQWPDVKTEITIGVLGNSPLYQGLQRMAATKSTYNLKFIIKKFNTPTEIIGCDVLFVPYASNFDIKQVSQKIAGKNIMLITEDEKVKDVTCFNFVVKEGKLMYQVNKLQCEKSKLKVSQKLLSLGILI